MDASNMLKPALARGELRVIGATTLDEYRKQHREGRRAGPPVPAGAGARAQRRGHRRHPARPARPVRGAPPGAVHRRGAGRRRRAVRPVRHRPVPAGQGDRPDRPGRRPGPAAHPHPGLRRAGAGAAARRRTPGQGTGGRRRAVRAGLRAARPDRRAGGADPPGATATTVGHPQVPEVGPQEIAEVVSRATGIPVSQLTEEERDRLLRLEGHLHEKVVGQDDAVSAVAEAVRRSRAGLADPEPADGQLPVPRPDRRRQDRAGPRPGRGAVRRGGPDGPGGHERVPGTAHRSAGWSARRPATSATRRPASSPRRCAAARTRWCCSTRSRRPTRTCSTSCSRCSTTGGSPTARAAR